MPSVLDTKINSYALERGIEFNEPYTITPTRTGTNPTTASWTAPTVKPIHITNDSPLGGSGCWEIAQSNLAASNSYYRAIGASTTELLGISDLNYSAGVWFKYTSLPTGTITGASSIISVQSNNGGFQVLTNGSSHATRPNHLSLSLGSGSLFSIIGTQIQVNTWYYLAVTRDGTGTSNYKIYLNGILVGTTTNTGTTVPNTLGFGSSGTTSSSPATLRFSNFYFAPLSVIGPTQISEIWTAGNTSPYTRTVRYFNGTSWVDSSAQKVWNGTAWVDWNAKRFDGSTWVTI